MTPEREAYLAKCGKRELWLRRLIKIHKEAIKKVKEQLRNDVFDSCGQVADCKSAMRANRWLIASLHHELAMLKGMDRVVVPFKSYLREVEDGVLVEYEVQTCPNCNVLVGGDLCEIHNYCPDCGRKILWERVK